MDVGPVGAARWTPQIPEVLLPRLVSDFVPPDEIPDPGCKR